MQLRNRPCSAARSALFYSPELLINGFSFCVSHITAAEVCDKCSPGVRCCSYTQISVSRSGPYRPPGGVEEMQGGGRRVRLEWGAYITV
ncbi:hypothetical protein FHG87_014284 [Trinorchestia longiramus]|nr:hypothetical protein FHG87_014284 [Trinorchestia longiramus]